MIQAKLKTKPMSQNMIREQVAERTGLRSSWLNSSSPEAEGAALLGAGNEEEQSSEWKKSRPLEKGAFGRRIELIYRGVWGDISKNMLLCAVLPLALASFVGTVAIGISMFPGQYDWKKQVLSRVISPSANPEGFWVPSLGIMATALLILPFAAYAERRLRAISPGIARWAGMALALGFLLCVSVAVPLSAEPGLFLRLLHKGLAGTAFAVIAVGVFCCYACALKDGLRGLGGRRSLGLKLGFCWSLLTLVPIGCGLAMLVTRLAQRAGQAWAVEVCAAVRPTMFWQLAFWEWLGIGILFAFFFVSVLLLPEQATAPALFPRLRGSPKEKES